MLCISISACSSSNSTNYFAQHGVSWDQYQDDETYCRDIASNSQSNTQLYTPDLIGAAVSGFISGVEQGKMRRMNYDACMHSKGYENKYITDEEYKSWRSLSKEQREEKLYFLVTGAPKPEAVDEVENDQGAIVDANNTGQL